MKVFSIMITAAAAVALSGFSAVHAETVLSLPMTIGDEQPAAASPAPLDIMPKKRFTVTGDIGADPDDEPWRQGPYENAADPDEAPVWDPNRKGTSPSINFNYSSD